MTKIASSPSPAAVDYDATLILSVETSNKNWVLAARVVPSHSVLKLA